MNTIKAVRFSDIQERELEQVRQIFRSVHRRRNSQGEDGYIKDFVPYEEILSHPANLGRFFLIFQAGKVAGYMFCLDNLDIPEGSSFPGEFLRKFLRHEYRFLFDLTFFPPFAFVCQLAIREGCRNKGAGKELVREFEQYYDERGTVILGSVIHEGNRPVMRLLKKLDYLFIDFYEEEQDKEIWFRVVKILREGSFFDSISTSLIPRIYATVIPIQLNLATRSINQLLSRINPDKPQEKGTRIVWSSFFQYDFPVLSNFFDMPKTYNGYHATLLDVQDQLQFDHCVEVLKDIYKYQKAKDNAPEYSIASVSPILKSKSFELFIVDREAEKMKFESFPNPVVLGLDQAEVADLMDSFEKLEKFIVRSKMFNRWEKNREGAQTKHLAPTKLIQPKYQDFFKNKILSPDELEAFEQARERNPNTEEGIFLKIRKKVDFLEEFYENWNDWIELHRKLYLTDRSEMTEEQYWCHAVVPISFSGGGVFGVMFSLIVDPAQQDKPSSLANDLAYIVSNALAKNMFNVIVKLQDIATRKFLFRSAIATIMARNFAHNLGSHVLAKLVTPRAWKPFISMGPGMKGLGKDNVAQLTNYIRTRMDFIADISTSEPSASISRRFKQDVLDRFNEEKIIKNFISGTKVDRVLVEFHNDLSGGQQDITVQIPQADLGNHAFYVILENIIRNACKHESDHISGEAVHITVRVRDRSDEERNRGFRVVIHDHIPRKRAKAKELAHNINQKFIDKPIIEGKSRLRKFAWGIAEMQIAAAYLRKKSPAEYLLSRSLLEKPISPSFLNAVPVPAGEEGHGDYYLGYEIYLKKPREAILVDSENYLLQEGAKPPLSWLNRGIRLETKEGLKRGRRGTSSHPILAVLDDAQRQEIEQSKNLPLRWVYLRHGPLKEQLRKLLFEDRLDDAVLLLWKYWLKGYLERKGVSKDCRLSCCQGASNHLEVKKADPAKLILYDYHGSNFEKASGLFQGSDALMPSQLLYYEAGFKPSQSRMLFEYLEQLPAYERERIRMEYIEAALTRVLLIDERIQQEVANTQSDFEEYGYTYFEELSWMGIQVPSLSEADLLVEDFPRSQGKQLCSWMQQKLEGQIVDFVVVHLGLIEKLTGTRLEHIQEFCDAYVRRYNQRAEIVIISGRGNPHELPPKSLFLNYSLAGKYIIREYKSKYHFCQLLFSARNRVTTYEPKFDRDLDHL